MPNRDFTAQVKAIVGIAPAILTASSTSAAIDVSNFDKVLIVANLGIASVTPSTTNKFSLVVKECSSSNGTFTAVAEKNLTGALAGTTSLLDTFATKYGTLNHININAQTIFGPADDAAGLLIDQDDNSGDGAHYAVADKALCDQEFIVGQNEFSMVVKVVAGDWTDSFFQAGFRTKAVYTWPGCGALHGGAEAAADRAVCGGDGRFAAGWGGLSGILGPAQ